MAQKTKVPFLETSQEKFQQLRGSGSYRSACPTPTGKNTAAILQPPSGSSSPTEVQSSTPWAVTWGDSIQATLDQMREKEPENCRESGEHGEIDLELLQFWNQRIPVRQK